MSRYIFIKEPDAEMEQPCITVRLEVDAPLLSGVVDTFKQFCLACGYAQKSIDDEIFGEGREG